MEYVLFIWIHASMLSNNDSMTSYAISGFKNGEACQAQGEQLKSITDGTMKVLKYRCLVVQK